MPEFQLLIFIVPIDIKDDVVDALIELKAISGFNLERIAGYSKEHSQYSLREQVEGSREMYRFEVMHETPKKQDLLAALAPVCEAARIRYWLVPVIEQDHFGSSESR
jgi:hypothetical protein